MLVEIEVTFFVQIWGKLGVEVRGVKQVSIVAL